MLATDHTLLQCATAAKVPRVRKKKKTKGRAALVNPLNPDDQKVPMVSKEAGILLRKSDGLAQHINQFLWLNVSSKTFKSFGGTDAEKRAWAVRVKANYGKIEAEFQKLRDLSQLTNNDDATVPLQISTLHTLDEVPDIMQLLTFDHTFPFDKSCLNDDIRKQMSACCKQLHSLITTGRDNISNFFSYV